GIPLRQPLQRSSSFLVVGQHDKRRFQASKTEPKAFKIPFVVHTHPLSHRISSLNAGDRVNAVLVIVPKSLCKCSRQVPSLRVIIDFKLLTILAPAAKAKIDYQHSQLNELLSKRYNVTQSLLSLNKSSSPTPQECTEVLVQALKVLHAEY
uniref:Uncharacterized protein n=1 Tax=Glossina pallidipes TaxID=7398 RepID=A0A1A9ZES0_GLOPL